MGSPVRTPGGAAARGRVPALALAPLCVLALALPHAPAFAESPQGAVPVERTATVFCDPSSLDAARASFPEEIRCGDDGAEGAAFLVRVDAVPVWGEEERAAGCDRTAVYQGLPENDVALLPAQSVFAGDAGEPVELSLAGVSWTVESTDEFGLPTSYTAAATYRGEQAISVSVLEGYEVTAVYRGEAEAAGDVSDGSAGSAAPDAPRLSPAPSPEGEDQESHDEGPDAALAAIAALACAAAATAVIVPVVLVRRRARVWEAGPDGKPELLGRAAVAADGGGLVIDIPARVCLRATPGAPCTVELPAHAARSEREVAVFACGSEVARRTAAAEMEIADGIAPKEV